MLEPPYYHWVRADRTLLDGNRVEVGYTYWIDEPIELCRRGLHASKTPLDALQCAPGPVLCGVELSGTVEHDHDKSVATERTVLWIVDLERELHEFGCWCADRALALIDKPDPRSIAAVQAKRDWLAGKIDDKELAAAREAASAASDAARAATWAASAAWATARAAACSAAWAAARTAARAAAWAAAMDAEHGAQNARLLDIIEEKRHALPWSASASNTAR